MKNRFLTVLIITSALVLSDLPAQESTPAQPDGGRTTPGTQPAQPGPSSRPPDPATSGPTGTPAPAGTQDPASGAAGEPAGELQDDLLRQTLELDIRTAGYYELVDWASRLGLEARGSREELQRLLYSHYGLTPPAPEPAAEGGERQRVITIESAQTTEYFTLETTDERYIRLSGDVVLELNDPETDAVHRISAEEMIFNETEDLFTANGNVEYVLKQGEREEKFIGDSISFRIDNWEGAFFDGITSRNRTVQSNNLTFYFIGDSIMRSEDDVIAMADGMITSCEDEEPHYSIKAKKIWILAPGEWGLSAGTLYVGRIPLFYFPFFFYPGDDMFFNPTFGYRDREGFFLQTTTYFIGERQKKDSSFSFLQLGEEEDSDKVKRREGLFLVRTEEKKPTDETRNWYLKLIADLYSRLGSFLGIEGKFTGKDFFKNLTFDLGLGFTRNIYKYTLENKTTSYTTFFIDTTVTDPTKKELKEYWNSSVLFGLKLPFRFSLGTTLDLGIDRTSLNARINLYSDPLVTSDFRNRSENMDWGTLFKMDAAQTSSGTTSSATHNFTWSLSGNHTFDTAFLAPFLNSFRINNAKTELTWISKQLPKTAVPVYNDDTTLPGKYFFHPENVVFFDYELSADGKIFSTEPAQALRTGTEKEDAPVGLKPPWDGQESGEGTGETAAGGEKEKADEQFRLPGVWTDASTGTSLVPFSLSTTYSASHILRRQGKMNSGKWIVPDDIDFTQQYSSIDTRNRLDLKYDLKIYNSLFTSTGGIQLRGDYRRTTKESPDFPDSTLKTLLQSDYSSSFSEATSTFTLSYSPFLTLPPLSGSLVTYSFAAPLYTYKFDRMDGTEPVYKTQYLEWKKESITTHNISFNLNATVFKKTQTLTLSSTLPPKDQEYAGTFSWAAWILNGSFSGSVKSVSDVWTFQPATISTTVKPFDSVSLSGTFIYDPDPAKAYWTSISTALQLWELSATLNIKRQVPFRFNWGTGKYEPLGPEALTFSDLTFRYLFNRTFEPFWKNRIKYSLTVDTNWRMNLVRYTDSPLSFSVAANLEIFEFLHFEFSSLSQNDSMFRYFPDPDMPATVRANIFEDLLKSFNFFNDDDRRASGFKIRRISFKLINRLHDWDLSLEYSGSPQQKTGTGGRLTFAWNSSFSVSLQWKPIPEVKSNIKVLSEPASGTENKISY